MKLVSIIGARPQFVKAAPVSRVWRQAHTEILVHTGQHYDEEMSAVFFRELNIPEPDYNLEVGSGPHGRQTGQMLARIEEVLLKEQPDWVLVYGDTNSTLAGALAAVKLHIPVAHVEAGLRSFNRTMPEEHNRVLTDHCADLLFCPTQTAVDWLAQEGVTQGVHLVGDVMYDAILYNVDLARQRSTILTELDLHAQNFLLATIHRPYNTDDPKRLQNILTAFLEIGSPIIFPVHPRTRRYIAALDTDFDHSNIKMIAPVSYLDMLALEQHARLILTDSGGVQKEAYFLAVPCATLRPETEWVETVQAGWNLLVDADLEQIVNAANNHQWPSQSPQPVFGDGRAAEKITDKLRNEN
ncbi:MAG: UDP-N-acetylglucosamine 2-epimerase (non-hydrolyzing) [Anaerolineae bacterium]|nr:UDP-N-acetylglucosamine 2-epimerase (non-hydrolyzing) [Anaerolineae bacterium]